MQEVNKRTDPKNGVTINYLFSAKISFKFNQDLIIITYK